LIIENEEKKIPHNETINSFMKNTPI